MTESSSSRRFTDREVALVLKKAAEIDEASGAGPSGGLALRDLEEIAKEVGISPDALTRAVEGLARNRTPSVNVRGAPLSRRVVHAVEGELNEDGLARLVRYMDENADSPGAVSQALGSIRWTSTERMKSLQVAITPVDGETRIQVVEKTATRLRNVLHLVPTSWGLVLGGTALASAQAIGGGDAMAAAIAAPILGLAIGRGIWTWISRSSAKRVERLAEGLSREAEEAVRRGHTQPASKTTSGED
jgi:hypothetical protein